MRLKNAPVTMPAACSTHWLLLVTSVAVSPLGATLVQAQLWSDYPPLLVVRVPVAPTPVPGDDGVHLVYELWVTNIDRLGREVTLKRVHAAASDGETLLSYEDGVLLRNIGPNLGTYRQGTDQSRIAPGMFTVVYMWVTVDSPEAVPALIRHDLTVIDLT